MCFFFFFFSVFTTNLLIKERKFEFLWTLVLLHSYKTFFFFFPSYFTRKKVFSLSTKDCASGLVQFLVLVVLIPIVYSKMLSVQFLQPHLSSWRVVPLYSLTFKYLSLLMLQLSTLQKTLVVSLEKAIIYYA